MALDKVMIDGDEATFSPGFGGVLVIVKPGKLEASGKTTIKGKKVCVEGDEKKVEVECDYIFGPFLGGKGTLKIHKLGPNQLTQKIKSGSKNVILRGSTFVASFKISTAGTNPANGAKDVLATHMGIGVLTPANHKIMAT